MALQVRAYAAVAASGVRTISSELAGPRFFAEGLFSAAPALAVPMPAKTVDLIMQPHMVFEVEAGADEFNFDNAWPDGSPKASFHKERLFHLGRSSRREWWHPIEGEILAHARALDLMRG